MSYASVYAALSYGNAGLHAGDGIAYAVAGQTHKSHGSTNAVVLPYVLDELRSARRAELLDVARMWGATGSDDAAVKAVPRLVRDLVAGLDIPTNLRDFGVPEDALDALVADALAVSRLARVYPGSDVAAAYRRIVRQAFDGRLSSDADGAAVSPPAALTT